MIELYKIISGKYDPSVCKFIKFKKTEHNTRGHKYKIEKEYTRLNIRKYSFIHRSVDTWNNLPAHVVNAKTVFSFEVRLDKLWEGEDFKFNLEATKPIAYRNPQLTSEDSTDLQSEFAYDCL